MARHKTASELLFERFCADQGLLLTQVPTQSDRARKTPDYEINAAGHRIVVEVKQIDPNPEDRRQFRLLRERGETDTITSEPGHRVRGKISDAMPQLKMRSKGRVPAMLVLYNNVKLIEERIDPVDIRTAMYGLEIVEIRVPTDPNDRRISARHRFGGKRKVSQKHNTSLSAVASMYEGSVSARLDVYHNDFAANPIAPDWLRNDAVRHFKLADHVGRGGLSEWIEL
jgi:hypothetical protein